MQNKAALRKTAEGWQFISESALEDFFWDNLENLLGFTPLERQLYVKGEICDLLALKERQLIIIELKNSEDRYIIQQLTRYYDNLLSQKPSSDKIDYDLPVRLIAISPNFHRHNFIDQKYNKLDFELITFSIIKSEDQFYLNLKNAITENQVQKIKVEYREFIPINQENVEIPSPPRNLMDWLGVLTAEEVENIIKIRNRILGFDRRIEEIVEPKSILYGSRYGKGKIKQCAEFGFDTRAKKILLFLWLEIPGRQNKTITRMQVDTVHEYSACWRFIPKKQGKLDSKTLEQRQIKGHGYYFFSNNSGKIAISLENLVDEALETWLDRA